jgi:GTP-dependent phosphoenolpyruvate carboxykinase
LAFDADGWRQELSEMAVFLEKFEPRVPEALHRQLAQISAALG